MTPQPSFAWGKGGSAPDTLAYRDAFVAWGERPEADIAATGDVVFVGYGIRAPEWRWDRSTLGSAFAATARAESLTVVSQPDVRGAFFRSDHFPFARSGVPVLSIRPGVDFVGRPKGWGEQQEAIYNHERYHQPRDEYQPTSRYDGMAQEVRVIVTDCSSRGERCGAAAVATVVRIPAAAAVAGIAEHYDA